MFPCAPSRHLQSFSLLASTPRSRRREREEPFLLSRNVQIADNNLKQENSFDKYSALSEIEEHCDSKVAQPLCRSVSGDSSSSLDSDLADFAKEIDDDLQQ